MLGAFITDRQSNTRLDSDAGDGTDLDIEDDLGLESSTPWLASAATSGSVTASPRWSVLRLVAHGVDTDPGDDRVRRRDVRHQHRPRDRVGPDDHQGRLHVRSPGPRPRVFRNHRRSLHRRDHLVPEPGHARPGSNPRTSPRPCRCSVCAATTRSTTASRCAGRCSSSRSRPKSRWPPDGLLVGADYGFGERMAVGLAYNRVSMNLGAIETRVQRSHRLGLRRLVALFQVRTWRQLALPAQIDSNIVCCRLG